MNQPDIARELRDIAGAFGTFTLNPAELRHFAARLERLADMLDSQPAPERWPCGCVKGETPHGAGWSDCEFAPAGAQEAPEPSAGRADAMPVVHSRYCTEPNVVSQCACGKNRVCRTCGWGAGQSPCDCTPVADSVSTDNT